MEKQRLLKMGDLEQRFLLKSLGETQKNTGKGQDLMDKIVHVQKKKLYLSDEEHEWAIQSLNNMRNDYLSAGRSCGGIDRVLIKLIKSKYRHVPAR